MSQALRKSVSWCALRWIESIEKMWPAAARPAFRGGLQLANRTGGAELSIREGRLEARVKDRGFNGKVRVDIACFDDATWDRALHVVARRAAYAAELLAGTIPRELSDELEAAGINLFPAKTIELGARCACPDAQGACRHVAALHGAFAIALDRDPFALFLLRGRGRDAVLRSAGRARAEDGADPAAIAAAEAELRALENAVRRVRRPGTVGYEVLRAALPEIPERAAEGAGTAFASALAERGNPPGWKARVALADALDGVVRDAAGLARSILTTQGPA